jgi:pyruvate/2-oxoglutarate dehydrogenase complex dihydrolipoamide acyltransferase (E2) component
MPFHYDLLMPTVLGEDSSSRATVLKLLVEPHAWVEAGSPIATVKVDSQQYEVLVVGRGAVLQFWVSEGQTVANGTPLARIGADGEDIPYGKPYAELRAKPLMDGVSSAQ